jgi:xanthine dehydrogenase YagT iron-sulfur-binding subunit
MGNQASGKKKKSSLPASITRRDFLKSVGVSSVGLAALEGEGLVGKLKDSGILPQERILGPHPFQARFLINGKEWITGIEPRATLADVIRDQLNLTGTKIGCNRGSCGACTVILNGRTVNSCLTLAVDAMDLPVQTIEGLAESPAYLHPLQQAFIEQDAMQCGFCTSGMIMSCASLLNHNSAPGDEDIREAVSGNLCRCATYPNVFRAVKRVAKK